MVCEVSTIVTPQVHVFNFNTYCNTGEVKVFINVQMIRP